MDNIPVLLSTVWHCISILTHRTSDRNRNKKEENNLCGRIESVSSEAAAMQTPTISSKNIQTRMNENRLLSSVPMVAMWTTMKRRWSQWNCVCAVCALWHFIFMAIIRCARLNQTTRQTRERQNNWLYSATADATRETKMATKMYKQKNQHKNKEEAKKINKCHFCIFAVNSTVGTHNWVKCEREVHWTQSTEKKLIAHLVNVFSSEKKQKRNEEKKNAKWWRDQCHSIRLYMFLMPPIETRESSARTRATLTYTQKKQSTAFRHYENWSWFVNTALLCHSFTLNQHENISCFHEKTRHKNHLKIHSMRKWGHCKNKRRSIRRRRKQTFDVIFVNFCFRCKNNKTRIIVDRWIFVSFFSLLSQLTRTSWQFDFFSQLSCWLLVGFAHFNFARFKFYFWSTDGIYTKTPFSYWQK